MVRHWRVTNGAGDGVEHRNEFFNHIYAVAKLSLPAGTISIPASMEFLQFLVTDYATDPDIPDVEVATMSISPARETLKTTMTQWGLLPEVSYT